MGKFIAALAMLAAAMGYYGMQSAQLDEELVRVFYAQQAHAALSRDPEALCSQFGEKLRMNVDTVVLGQVTSQTLNRSQACDDQRRRFRRFAELGSQAGGKLNMNYEYTIDQLQVAPDRKSATVTHSSAMNVGNGLVIARNVSTEQLTREWGTVLLQKADVTSKVRNNVTAMADPAGHLAAP